MKDNPLKKDRLQEDQQVLLKTDSLQDQIIQVITEDQGEIMVEEKEVMEGGEGLQETKENGKEKLSEQKHLEEIQEETDVEMEEEGNNKNETETKIKNETEETDTEVEEVNNENLTSEENANLSFQGFRIYPALLQSSLK